MAQALGPHRNPDRKEPTRLEIEDDMGNAARDKSRERHLPGDWLSKRLRVPWDSKPQATEASLWCRDAANPELIPDSAAQSLPC